MLQVLAFRETGCNYHFHRVLDLVLAVYKQWVFTTNMTHSVAIGNYGDVQAFVAELHR